MLEGARRDQQTRTADWNRVMPTIDGVRIKNSRTLVTGNGSTAEAFRSDWAETGYAVGHILVVSFLAGRISAWHVHETQADAFFVIRGRLLLALHDDRASSPTRGLTMALRLADLDPVVVTVPPGIWHGLKPLDGDASALVMTDQPFRYEAPDEWRLPPDTDKIPFDILAAR